jgi:hypothetical protein
MPAHETGTILVNDSYPVTVAVAEADVGKLVNVSSGNAIINTTANGKCVGAFLYPTATTERAVIAQLGTLKLKAGGTIAKGDLVASNNAGLAIAFTGTGYAVGIAQSAGVNNGWVDVALNVLAPTNL